MKPGSQISKCFGYVTFKQQSTIRKVLEMEHTLDDNLIVVQLFNSKTKQGKSSSDQESQSQEEGKKISPKSKNTNNDHFISKNAPLRYMANVAKSKQAANEAQTNSKDNSQAVQKDSQGQLFHPKQISQSGKRLPKPDLDFEGSQKKCLRMTAKIVSKKSEMV